MPVLWWGLEMDAKGSEAGVGSVVYPRLPRGGWPERGRLCWECRHCCLPCAHSSCPVEQGVKSQLSLCLRPLLPSLTACPWELASHFFLRSALLREWARAEGGGRRMVGQVNS